MGLVRIFILRLGMPSLFEVSIIFLLCFLLPGLFKVSVIHLWSLFLCKFMS